MAGEEITRKVLDVLEEGRRFKWSAAALAHELTKLIESELQIEKRGRNMSTRALYLLLQLKHRGIFTVTDEELKSFGFDPAQPIKTAIGITYNPQTHEHVWAVPENERKLYVLGADNMPFADRVDGLPYFSEE